MEILDLGVQAAQHREQLDDVKRQVGVEHNHFDGWIYSFLENKHFDVAETVAKLQRRADMERNELSKYVLTEEMLSDMKKGVIQLIGEDKEGRITFYITTKRDFPKSSQRETRKKAFDIWLSYGTRLRRDNKRCRIAMLINQADASMWSNLDMGFQSNIALRISKFYPGAVDKMYVCKMGKALAAMAKPIFSALPQVVSEHIFIVTDADIKDGRLLQHYDASVLPVALGGTNQCDTPENWEIFAKTISEYWARLSAGIADGKSVKEWELEQILAEEASEKRKLEASVALSHQPDQISLHRSRSQIQASSQSHDADTADLHTCFSDDDEMELDDVDININPSMSTHPLIVDPFSRLDYFMGRARYDIEKEEDIYRVALLMLCGSEGKAIAERGEYELDEAHTHAILRKVPTPLRGIVKGILWLFCIFLAVYFFVGTLFLCIVITAMMTQLFYATFVDWFYVWPLGITAMLLGYHLFMVCSRGFGLVVTSFRGQVIPALNRFGTTGFVIQMSAFILIVVAQLIIFIYYATTIDPVSGARISFSTGWMSCSIVIAIFHLLYPLGLRESPAPSKSSSGSLSLYLFFDLSEQDHPPRARRSAIAISLVPIVLSLLFGIAFMASQMLFFLVATPIAAILTTVCVNFFARRREKDFGALIIRANAWFLSLMWIWVSIIGGIVSFDRWWTASVAVTCSIVGILALLCIINLSIRKKSLYMRFIKININLMLVLFIASVVIAYWAHWGFIIIMLLLGIHMILCTTQRHGTNLLGDTLGVIGPLIMFCAILLLGHVGMQPSYQAPRSFGPQVASNQPSNSRLQRYPVCLSRYAANTTIIDLVLFAELVNADENAFDTDFLQWFPEFTDNGIVVNEPYVASVREFQAPNGDLVLAFRGPVSRMNALLSLTIWTEILTLYPITFSLPRGWIPPLVKFFGYVDRLIPFPSERALQSINSLVANRLSNGTQVVLVGHGIGGAAAGIVGVTNKIHAVSFSSPGLEYAHEKLDLTDNLEDYLTQIVTSNDALGNIDDHGDMVQSFNCEEGIMACSNIHFMAVELMKVCGDTKDRRHNQDID